VIAAFSCFIPGDPFGKAVVSGGRFGRFKDAKTVSKMGIAMQYMQAAHTGPPIEGPTRVTVTCYVRRTSAQIPKTGPRIRTEQPPEWAYPCPQKPDADNVAKLIGDCLTQAGVIVDDKAIVSLHVDKWYVAYSTQPEMGPSDVGVAVTVERINPRLTWAHTLAVAP